MENAVHGLGVHAMNVGDSAMATQMGSMQHMQPDNARAADLLSPATAQ